MKSRIVSVLLVGGLFVSGCESKKNDGPEFFGPLSWQYFVEKPAQFLPLLEKGQDQTCLDGEDILAKSQTKQVLVPPCLYRKGNSTQPLDYHVRSAAFSRDGKPYSVSLVFTTPVQVSDLLAVLDVQTDVQHTSFERMSAGEKVHYSQWVMPEAKRHQPFMIRAKHDAQKNVSEVVLTLQMFEEPALVNTMLAQSGISVIQPDHVAPITRSLKVKRQGAYSLVTHHSPDGITLNGQPVLSKSSLYTPLDAQIQTQLGAAVDAQIAQKQREVKLLNRTYESAAFLNIRHDTPFAEFITLAKIAKQKGIEHSDLAVSLLEKKDDDLLAQGEVAIFPWRTSDVLSADEVSEKLKSDNVVQVKILPTHLELVASDARVFKLSDSCTKAVETCLVPVDTHEDVLSERFGEKIASAQKAYAFDRLQAAYSAWLSGYGVDRLSEASRHLCEADAECVVMFSASPEVPMQLVISVMEHLIVGGAKNIVIH